MSYFKVVRKGGVREIEQLDPARSEPSGRPFPTVEDGLLASKGSPAFQALFDHLYDRTAPWALEEIRDLQTAGEVEEARKLERAHPKYPDGRVGVLNALDERLGELTTDDPNPGLARSPAPAPEEPTSRGPAADLRELEEDALAAADAADADPAPAPADAVFPCPADDCPFEASSEEGLAAHLEAVHDEGPKEE